MGLTEWVPVYDGDWRDVEVDDEFREQVWQPYRVWRKRSGKTSMRSGRVADHGAEFIQGLMEYYDVHDEEIDDGAIGSAAALAAFGDDSDDLRKVLKEESGFFSSLGDYL